MAASRPALDPIAIAQGSSGPMYALIWLLVVLSFLVWLVIVLKMLQVHRVEAAQLAFDEAMTERGGLDGADTSWPFWRHAVGARVVEALARARAAGRDPETAAELAVVTEEGRLTRLMTVLSSIGSAAPLLGLFGTVYGIMEAFIRIGVERSSSLPVVAPAIGEALLTTAMGLFAAIPAVVAYNLLARRIDGLLQRARVSANALVRTAPRSTREDGAPSACRELLLAAE